MSETIAWKGKRLESIGDGKYRCRGAVANRYYVMRSCSWCASSTFVTTENAKRNPGAFCSRACQTSGTSGERNSHWAGGRKNKRGRHGGHILAYAPNHPFARKRFVPEHRLVVEREIGRYLHPDEFVHHIDCNPANNDPSNLVIVNRWQHNAAHAALEHCVASLLRSGALRFNRETLAYEAVS